METPYTNHIKPEEYEFVYEPAEDTFLLLDALEKDLPFLETARPQVCLEIGSGSGVIITALSKRLRNTFCLASDLNRLACLVTKRTSLHNSGFVESINTNLANGLRANSVDLLIFNPPYVVTDSEELDRLTLNDGVEKTVTTNQLVRTWAGGKNGRIVIDLVLKDLDKILSPQGVFYLLVLRENQPNDISETLSKMGFRTDNFMERKIPGEHLYVLKITRDNKCV